MRFDVSSLTAEQRQFLALLSAAARPIAADVATRLSPIRSGSLLAMMAGDRQSGWIQKLEDHCYGLSPDIPPDILAVIDEANTEKRLGLMADRIKRVGLADNEVVRLWSYFMGRAGRDREAAGHLTTLARRNLENEAVDAAQNLLAFAASHLSHLTGEADTDRHFTSAALDLSRRSYAHGKGPGKTSAILKQAAAASRRTGDRRSYALTRLHLGRLLHVSGQHTRALTALQEGLDLVEALGDVDILIESAAFIGTYYYIQGMYRDAAEHLERALHTFESGKVGMVWDPSAPVLFGYCAAYLGWFNRSVGSLDCNIRLARQRGDRGLAATLRSALGTILVLTGNPDAAVIHLEAALEEANNTNNDLAVYLARGGLAFQSYCAGQLKEAYEMMSSAAAVGISAGFAHHYSSPWILEMIFDFSRQGFQIPGFSFNEELARIMNRSNVHLKGVGLRLKAASADPESGYQRSVADLAASIDLLKRSGDPVQLARSRLALARIKSCAGLEVEASVLVEKARKAMATLPESMWPDDISEPILNPVSSHPGLLNQALGMLTELSSVEVHEELLTRTVIVACDLFKAERGGLFRYADQSTATPELAASCHLTSREVQGEQFRPNLELVLAAFENNRSLMRRFGAYGRASQDVKAAVCLPLFIQGRSPWVLYLDTTYQADRFMMPDEDTADRLASHIRICLDLMTEYGRLKNEKSLLSSEKTLFAERLKREELVCNDDLMTDLLGRADQVADSNLTVLILGETGTGKELMARRLHKVSPRRTGPYVVVDLTGIPETLLESELFGHEKGAFTGADRQKRGRLELAHKGTLFFDEIGEISRNIQVKLLRAIQEKTFVRVGGMRTIHSDFRLVAATNRNLEEEVAAGRFRQDLYYRLNVVPLSLPPLRARGDDVILLANHFLARYARKHGRKQFCLSAENENRLKAYNWPGNIRELQNVMERAVILSIRGELEITLPEITEASGGPARIFADNPTLDEIQRRYIEHVLNQTRGKLSGTGGATDILGMKRQTLYARMKKLGLR